MTDENQGDYPTKFDPTDFLAEQHERRERERFYRPEEAEVCDE